MTSSKRSCGGFGRCKERICTEVANCCLRPAPPKQDCGTCATPQAGSACLSCVFDSKSNTFSNWRPKISGLSATFVAVDELEENRPSLPEDADARNTYPMADGLLDYFPNALAEVSKLSFLATQQHHPEKGMHWDRSKSLDHRNKIMRHLIDTDTVDDKGIDHWAMVCWRALAGYQEYLERKHGLRPSRASRNLPTPA